MLIGYTFAPDARMNNPAVKPTSRRWNAVVTAISALSQEARMYQIGSNS